MSKLHGKDKQARKDPMKSLLHLREANTLLAGGEPQIGIMLSHKQAYSHKDLPGFITVPAKDFSPESLLDYVQKNIHESRVLAKKYVEQ